MDFYGLFAYGAHNLTDKAVISGDIGYMQAENDISSGMNYGGSGDTKVWTAGVRADVTVYDDGAFAVTPHLGVRYTNFSMDTINQTATDDMNVVETPVGVTVKGKVQTAGWNVTPALDLSVVPRMGDKEAKVWNSGVAFDQRVLESGLFNAAIGVSGQKGNFSFGVNYRIGVGSFERENHSFTANVRYSF